MHIMKYLVVLSPFLIDPIYCATAADAGNAPVNQEFVIKRINGKDAPDEIPEAISIRVYLNSFGSIAGMFDNDEDHIRNVAGAYEISREEARAMRETLLGLYRQDQQGSTTFSQEICSPLLKKNHESKSIDEFLAYLDQKQSNLDQQIVKDFHDRTSNNVSDDTYSKIQRWMKKYTIPSINHVEFDKPAMYHSLEMTPSRFLISYC